MSAITAINLVATALGITASTTETGFPVSRLREPEFRTEPWHSNSLAQTTIVIDHGQAIAADRVSLIACNFTSCQIQENSADSWGAPAYSSATLTIGRDFDHRIYRRWFTKGGGVQFTQRFTRIVIPAQSTTDGAGGFSLGGIVIGLAVAPPVSPRPGYTAAVRDPRLLIDSESEWIVQYETGAAAKDAVARQSWTRVAAKTAATPGVGDHYGAWLDIDRSIAEAGGLFTYYVDLWGTGAVWMMRLDGPQEWHDGDASWAESPWNLIEATAG